MGNFKSKFKSKNILLGLYEKALPDYLTWEEKLIAVKDAGYDFVEISIDESDERIERLNWDKLKIIRLKQLIEKTSVPIITMCLSGNRRYPIGSSFLDIQKTGTEIILKAIKFSFNLGIRIIQIAGYDVTPDEKSSMISKKRFEDNIRRCVSLAASLGVMLAVENVESEFANSLEKLSHLVKKINSPWLQLYPDFGNLKALDQDVEKELRIYSSNIVAIHVKDTKRGMIRNIPFGKGEVDFISVFNVLKSVNFNGPFLLEMWADRKENYLEVIKSAREFIIEKLYNSKYFLKGKKNNKEVNFKEKLEIENANAI